MDKGSAVRQMFERIAFRYDAANTVMTGGLDAWWRHQAVASLRLRPDARVLDLCCGSGALTRALAACAPQGHVVGIDFSENMLAVARRRAQPNVTYQHADALALPFGDRSFDAAAMAFSMRNITDIPVCLREIARVLKPGARFANLEVGKPPNPLLRRAFEAYFYGVIPILGGIVGGDAAAYRYLPQSLINFPDAQRLSDLFAQNGFGRVQVVRLFGGVACLHIGESASRAEQAAIHAYATSPA